MGWLFGTLASAGITIPSEFSVRAVVGLILQILGITYYRIRAKVARIIGERNVAMLDRVWGYVSTLIREGPIGLWGQIREDLGNLKDMVIEGIKQWVVTRIITSAIKRLVSMFNPAGAIVQAVMAIYNAVMFFIERIDQIMELAQSIVRSLGAIVRGQLSAAANRVEQVMGLTLPVIISFFARLLGLGGIAGTISNIIGRARRRVDRAVDSGLMKVVRRVRGIFGRGRERREEDRRTRAQKERDLNAATEQAKRIAMERGATPETVRRSLPRIKEQYGLTRLTLVHISGDRYRIHGEVNPTDDEEVSIGVESQDDGDLENVKKNSKEAYDAALSKFEEETDWNTKELHKVDDELRNSPQEQRRSIAERKQLLERHKRSLDQLKRSFEDIFKEWNDAVDISTEEEMRDLVIDEFRKIKANAEKIANDIGEIVRPEIAGTGRETKAWPHDSITILDEDRTCIANHTVGVHVDKHGPHVHIDRRTKDKDYINLRGLSSASDAAGMLPRRVGEHATVLSGIQDAIDLWKQEPGE